MNKKRPAVSRSGDSPSIPPILQVVGYSNSGKTTLVSKLIRELTIKGLSVGSLKHDAHDFEIDHPGKDTWKHREAGAKVVGITSATKAAVIFQQKKSIVEMLPFYYGLDLLIIEGYKFADYPKIVVVRTPEHEQLLTDVTNVLCVAAWNPLPDCGHRRYSINDTAGITGEVLDLIGEQK
ncbi:molybdopterin-guanine dinucleotide biosynthesis protein B [Aneurinibacillus terranovensis]|uniref:molybdopterin-guanine dinucleotide biosynthesis protein B n=1 Tax=Aneurinibacillus terranovensis TaxID=278991 RepID=UPI000425FE3E|nr:molybdopterin-guanine dinucleotide biosynthesis protein B [Aneurinibacillus terranovensis]